MSAGDRDPDAEGTEGMSASKMRDAVTNKDFTTFSQGLPKSVSNQDAKTIYNTVRKGMGLKEQTEFKNKITFDPVDNVRESYVQGELFNIGDSVVIKENDVVGTIKILGPNYLIIESNGVTYRKWLTDVELIEKQDPDIKDRDGTQPAKYHSGLKKSTKVKRDAQFKKQAKMSDDNPAAYKPAPGDATAKTKPSKHTLKFKSMYGESENEKLAKSRIDREKKADSIRHDRMLDRARMRETKKTNRETK